MNRDSRCNFLNEVSLSIEETDNKETVIAKLSIILDKYEITERVTDLTLCDDANMKLVKTYASSLIVDGKARTTIEHYVRELKIFVGVCAGQRLEELTSFDIKSYLAKRKMDGLCNRTLDNVRAILAAFFSWLSAEEYIPKNICANIKPIKYTRELRQPFSAVELDKIRSNCKNPKERAIVEFLLSSGVRVSEFCALDVSDVNFTDSVVHIRHGKGDKERFTYINELTKEHLKKYLGNRTEGALFVTQRNERYTKGGIRYLLHSIERRAEIKDVHPHRFRRTFATSLASRGMKLQEIQRLLGHSDINTTMVYVTVSDAETKLSYAKFA